MQSGTINNYLSGGSFQAFWHLSSATAELDRVESINAGLAKQLGDDNCHNIDRIMRLPGPINVLGAQKIKRGRKPALAYVVEEGHQRSCDLGAFSTKVVGPTASPSSRDIQSIDLADVRYDINEFLQTLLQTGDDPAAPRGSDGGRYKSRSEALWRAINELIRAGWEKAIALIRHHIPHDKRVCTIFSQVSESCRRRFRMIELIVFSS